MKIKEKPEDFYVREIIDLKSKNPGTQYTYFLMWKKNLSTIRAIKIVAKNLRISKKRVFFAGEKDKKTVSEQYIAIKNLKDFKYEYNFGNVKLKYVGNFDDPIRISDILMNQFIINIKDVNDEEVKCFEKNLDIFKNYFFNYFDEQRFGDVRCVNHLIGKAIIKKNWEEAVKILLTAYSNKENEKAIFARKWLKENWGKFEEAIKYYPKWLDVELSILNYLIKEKDYYKSLKKVHKRLLKLFLHSYQSYLWNLIISEFVKDKSKNLSKIKVAEIELYISKDIDFIEKIKNKSIKLIGYDIKESEIDKDFIDIYRKVLEKEKISSSDLYFEKKPSLTLKSINRRILAEVKDLDYKIEKNTIKICFYLDKGSYATTYIKHLFSE